MKKHLFSLLIILFGGYSAMAQLITFDDQGHTNGTSYGNPYSITNGGETFVFTLSGGSPTSHVYRTTETFCGNSGLDHMSAGTVSQTTWTIETQSGNEVNLGTIEFDNVFTCFAFTYNLSIQGFKNGSPVGTQAFAVNSGFGNVFNSNSSFDDVDKIVISASDLSNLGIDNINWVSVAPPCTSPTVPTLTSTPTTVCAGGSATLNITGTLNDATQWAVYTGSCGGTLLGTTTTSSFIVSPSANTTYFVRGEGGCVTLGSCGSVTVNVTNIALPVASQTSVSCFGGSNGAASVTAATGGTAPYSYNWTPGNPTGDGTTSVTGLSAGSWTCTVTDANGCTKATTIAITQPSALSLTAVSQTTVSCFGGANGAAAVSASGGTAAYSYNWTPGNPSGDGTTSVTGLSAGAWTCTVTDANSCTATRTFAITQPSAIVLNAATQNNVTCFGGANGAASVTAATGGSGPYTYNWTPGNPVGDGTTSVSGLTAGAWTCTVTDNNGCTATRTFAVTQPSAIVLNAATQNNVTCFGGANGAASVTAATGGSGPYTYNWTPGNPVGDGTTSVSGLTAGTWTCTVTDANACTASQTFTVTQPSAISLTPASQTNISCFGGSNGAAAVNAATGGAGGYTYNWTPGNPTGDGTVSVTGLSAGTWTCTVTDANACTAAQTFTVTQPSALVATPVSQTNVSCFGGANGAASLSASGGAAGYTYNWTPGNPVGDGTASVTGLTAGSWTCTVTDANSCTAAQTFTVTQPTAISLTPASQTNVSCFGGSNGAAAVNAATGGAGGYTYNWTPGNPTGDGTVSVTGLSAGSWTCTVTDANACTASQTFTVTQPAAISLTPASQTNVSCFGGSNGAAAVNAATGGAGGYTYNWTPGNPVGDGTVSVTGLSAGSWTCTVTDANACTASQTFTVTQSSALTVTPASQTNIACFGGANGAAAVNAPTGGAGGYTFNWTPGNPVGDGTASVTGLTAGSWTCTVTDANGCTAAQTFTVTQPSALVLTPLASAEPTCGSADGSASVNTATGGAGGYTYDWTPGNPTGDGTVSVTGLTAGSWTCTVTDANSCTASTSFTLNPVDITPPTAVCQDITVFLDGSGNASITASDLDGGSFDDCGGVTLSASQTAFTCVDMNPAPSGNLVITGIYDGPLAGGTPKGVELYVLNDIADLSLYGLGSANNGTGTSGQEFTFPSVAATAGTYLYVSSESTEFANYFGFAPDYTDVSMGVNGDDAVELFFNGSVLDVFGDINIDGTGQVWEYLDGWAYRTNNSGPDASTFAVSNWTYSGINALDNETTNATAVTPFPIATYSYVSGPAPVAVTLTVTDGGANSSTCTANVSVLDTISPVVTCPGDQIESSSASCDFTLPDYTGLTTSSDNCGVVTVVQSPVAGTVISAATVITMTATDASGNVGTCSFNVTLNDAIAPTAICQNVNVYLNGAGTASIVAADIDGGSVDNCSGITLSASQTAFTCSDLGANSVTLTVTDGNSNVSTCTATVTVIDTIAPVAICQNITAYLDGSGTAIVFSGQVDGGSVDNCSIAGTSSSPAIFTCANLGTNNVTFTVTDGSGNNASCTSVVTIVDTISPVPSSATLADVNAACSVTSLTDPSATDNCGSITVTNNAVLPINTAGTTVVTWTYTDDSGNSVSQNQNVIITNSTTTGVDTQVQCDSYTWIDGITYNSSNNTATFTLPNAAGCDSIVTLNLTINNSNAGVDTQVQCDSYTWIDGITYNSSNNTATFTVQNAAGCDSVVTLNLTINNSNTGVDTQVQCDSYIWIDGITYTSSNNSATFTVQNAAGCDSVVTLNLTINNSNTGVDTRTECNSFTWIDGITYTSSNNSATFTVQNAAGCDSVVTLNLTILTEVFSNISDTGCDSYTWAQNGMTYTTSGIYSDTIVGGSVNGCDSIIVLDLTINQSSSSVDVVNECDSYTWIDGNTYTASNNSATVVFTNAAGCDSVVTLNLTLGFTTTTTEVVSLCDPSYTWAANGTTYTSSGTYTTVLTSVEGCDSTVILDLTLGGGIDLTVTQAGETLIASQFVANYQWIDCSTNQPIPGEIGQSFSPSTSGSYAVIITDNNCTDTSACVNITVTGLDELDSDKVTIYPNPSSGNEVTFVYDGNISSVQVFDVVGRPVINTSKLINNKLDVSNLSYGKYIVRISTESSVVTKELIIAR